MNLNQHGVIQLPCLLAYADDLLFICKDEGDVQRILETLEPLLASIGLEINVDKTAVLFRDPFDTKNTAEDTVKQFGKYLLKVVTKMRYLGAYVTSSLTRKEITAERIKKAKKAFQPLCSFMKKFKLEWAVVKRLYHALITPIATYAMETGTLLKENRNALRDMENYMLEKLLNLSKDGDSVRRTMTNDESSHGGGNEPGFDDEEHGEVMEAGQVEGDGNAGGDGRHAETGQGEDDDDTGVETRQNKKNDENIGVKERDESGRNEAGPDVGDEEAGNEDGQTKNNETIGDEERDEGKQAETGHVVGDDDCEEEAGQSKNDEEDTGGEERDECQIGVHEKDNDRVEDENVEVEDQGDGDGDIQRDPEENERDGQNEERDKAERQLAPLLLGSYTVNNKIWAARLNMYGHIIRSPTEGVLRSALEYNIDHPRKRGRPCHTWCTDIRTIIQRSGTDIAVWQDYAWDRCKMKCETKKMLSNMVESEYEDSSESESDEERLLGILPSDFEGYSDMEVEETFEGFSDFE